MLPTGDVQGCLRKLETLLRIIKYPGNVDYTGLSKGEPSAFLPVLSFSLTTFSPPFTEQLVAAGLELTGKTDLRFTDTLYKVLRDIFHYKPVVSKQQFLQSGFAQRKISTLCDIIGLVLKRHGELKKPRVKNPVSHKDARNEERPNRTKTDIVCDTPFVDNHLQKDISLSCQGAVQTSHSQLYSNIKYSEHGNANETEKKQKQEDIQRFSQMEQRLSVMEIQIETLLSGFQRLSVLEDHLEELARRTNTKEGEEEMITIPRKSWDNLNGRILLLETKLELGLAKSGDPPSCKSSTPDYAPSSISDASKCDVKNRLERITNMLKSTSTLMKNTDASTTPSA
ncbi:centrosomal protein of 44 kDa [Stigmatopora argus]